MWWCIWGPHMIPKAITVACDLTRLLQNLSGLLLIVQGHFRSNVVVPLDSLYIMSDLDLSRSFKLKCDGGMGHLDFSVHDFLLVLRKIISFLYVTKWHSWDSVACARLKFLYFISNISPNWSILRDTGPWSIRPLILTFQGRIRPNVMVSLDSPYIQLTLFVT